MEHVLDNPAWNALISGNKRLAFGSGPARYFDREVSPFAALEENSEENFRLLREILPHSIILFVAPVEMEFSPQWNVLQHIHGLQMVYDTALIPDEVTAPLVRLTDEHIPQMLDLTKLTN